MAVAIPRQRKLPRRRRESERTRMGQASTIVFGLSRGVKAAIRHGIYLQADYVTRLLSHWGGISPSESDDNDQRPDRLGRPGTGLRSSQQPLGSVTTSASAPVAGSYV